MFENISTLNFRFRDGFESMDGFQLIPFERIGLIQDEYRDSPVNRSYRAEIYKRYLRESGGHYDPEVINACYHVRSNESDR